MDLEDCSCTATSPLQDGHWVLDDLHLIRLNVAMVTELLTKAGAKSLGTTVWLINACFVLLAQNYTQHAVCLLN